MGIDFLASLGLGSYSDIEGQLSTNDKNVVNAIQQQINDSGWDNVKKNTVINLLNQIEDIISGNRSITQQQMNQLIESENIIKKQIKDLDDSNTVLKDLQKQEINTDIQNIANEEYAESFAVITEYNYRLGLITQQKQVIKQQLIGYDEDMSAIQLYIKSLQ